MCWRIAIFVKDDSWGTIFVSSDKVVFNQLQSDTTSSKVTNANFYLPASTGVQRKVGSYWRNLECIGVVIDCWHGFDSYSPCASGHYYK